MYVGVYVSLFACVNVPQMCKHKSTYLYLVTELGKTGLHIEFLWGIGKTHGVIHQEQCMCYWSATASVAEEEVAPLLNQQETQ